MRPGGNGDSQGGARLTPAETGRALGGVCASHSSGPEATTALRAVSHMQLLHAVLRLHNLRNHVSNRNPKLL